MKLADMIRLGVKGFKPSDIKTINESGISTEEIINLAENGYSIADVNELISLAGTDEQVQPGNEAPADPHGPADHAGNEGESNVDYEEKIKAQAAELERMKTALEAVQKQNSSRNLGSGQPEDPRKQIQEAFRSIY